MDDEGFWRKTPRQLDLIFAGHNTRLIREHNSRAWMVWHAAALQRAKQLGSLARLQARQPQEPVAWQDQLEGLKRWVIATGGKVVTRQH